VSNLEKKILHVSPDSGLNNNQLNATVSNKKSREAERLATLDYLGAIRPGTDHILQQLVDEVRSIFGTDLCMVNLNLSRVQYFKAWSGELPPDLAEARQDSLENSMCQYVVNTEVPLVVEDFLATEEFREQHWCVNYGIHFYAGTPLITSDEHAIGTLCLLNAQPIEFGQEQMRVLGGFAQAVIGRLELLAALGREQAAREKETQRSEERKRTLDSLSAHIAIIDESGTIVAVNKAWRHFAQAGGVAGQNYAEGVNYLRVCDSAAGAYSEEAAPFAEGIRSILSGRREKFELEYPCHSPSERRWFIARVTPFAGGGSSGAVVAHENITERKLAEEALRESEATLNSILNNLAEGVLVADSRGHVVFVNSAARAMLGVTGRQPLDQLPDPWEDFSLPDAVAHCTRSSEGIEAEVRDGESSLRVKMECLVEGERGRGEVLVVIQDLSAGRQLETSQQRFLANAAHQLRTPIMAIVGAAELLATGEDTDPAIKRRLLNHIFTESRRMQRLSDTLLRLSRIGWDQREPDLEAMDLREAGQQAAELMEPLAESGGLRILTEGEGACVRADSEWLQEVLLVLLSNAIKHSSRGGDIRVRVRPGSVTVEDEGVGIDQTDLPHIFERFYKGRGSSEGFGLGLSICKELTERMGGTISVRSREGVGTAVKVELPEASVNAQHTDR
jgi:signal transduction histidine kinase